MDSALLGIAVAVGINIIVLIFSMGKLYQKIGDLCRRISQLEKKVENTDTHIDELSERIAHLEGRLQTHQD